MQLPHIIESGVNIPQNQMQKQFGSLTFSTVDWYTDTIFAQKIFTLNGEGNHFNT